MPDAKSKADKPPAKAFIDPKMLKWMFIALVVALFIAALVIQYGIKTNEAHADPYAEMRKEMGIENSTEPPPSALVQAFEKMKSTDQAVKIEGMEQAMQANQNASSGYIARFLADADPTIRKRAIELLAQYAVPGAGGQILPLLADSDNTVRAAASTAAITFKAEPGLLYGLITPLSSRDPAIVVPALAVWRSSFTADRDAALRAITYPLSSDDDAILQPALTAVSNSLSPEEMVTLRSVFENISSRKPNTPVGITASQILANMPTQQ